MFEADTQMDPETPEQGNDGVETPSAGGAQQEISIPKHRFDQVLAERREMKGELDALRGILQGMQQGQMNQAQQAQDEIRPEDYGMDPDSYHRQAKLLKTIVAKELKPQTDRLNMQLAQVADENEKLRFLVQNGPDKAKYLDGIKAVQEHHAKVTGTYLPAESAYKILAFDEMNRKARTQQRPQAPQNSQPAPAGYSQPSVPGRDLTSSVPQSGSGQRTGAPVQKGLNEMTAEEIANLLEGTRI